MFLQFLLSFLLQIVFTIGVIVLFGFIIALLNKLFYSNFGRFGHIACYVTGFIGTPIHECAHALFCIIFGHKIEAMQLFQISSDDGTLGFVLHSYNKKNVYHRIGNFFIGIAPILVISALLFLLAYLLVPAMSQGIIENAQQISTSASVGEVFGSIWACIKEYFMYVGDYRWWIFLFISIFFALHMTLSGADIRGSLGGLGFVLLIILIVDVVCVLLGPQVLATVTSGYLFVGGFLIGFLILATVVSLCATIISFIVKIILGN